jgi:DNA-binding SARP family transcriptional activator
MLNVTLLGGASISVDGAVVRSDLGPAGRLLAFYLFEFPVRAHRRERLADLFWGELDPDKARSALNTAIWRIRKMMDLAAKGAARHLITVGNEVVLEDSSTVQVDTRQLENASRCVLSRPEGVELTRDEMSCVHAAVANYAGPFLDGYDGDWVLQERERLHCLFVRSSVELMRTAAAQGQYERALDFGRKILAMDPLRESVQRDMMLLLVLNGQRVEAIRAYRRLIGILKTELDIEPMPETEQLYRGIVSGAIFGRIDDYASAHFAVRNAAASAEHART